MAVSRGSRGASREMRSFTGPVGAASERESLVQAAMANAAERQLSVTVLRDGAFIGHPNFNCLCHGRLRRAPLGGPSKAMVAPLRNSLSLWRLHNEAIRLCKESSQRFVTLLYR